LRLALTADVAQRKKRGTFIFQKNYWFVSLILAQKIKKNNIEVKSGFPLIGDTTSFFGKPNKP